MTADTDHDRALEVLGKITPGEWRIGHDKAAYLIPIREHSAGAHVIAWAEGCKDVRRPLQETEANACAIAAVPALVALYATAVELRDADEALSRAESLYMETFSSHGDEEGVFHNVVSPARSRLSDAKLAFNEALAAIPKAVLP